jgi:MFS family permease
MSIAQQMAARSQGVFYGWWIVAAVFVCEMFAIGSTSYAFGLFVIPVGEELGLSRADANTGLILLLAGMGASAPLTGRLLDKVPVRAVLVGGALTMGVGFVVLALAHSPWVMGASMLLLVGPGAGAIGPLSATTVVTRWFNRSRGKAMGLTAVATSVGGSVLVPVMAFNLSLLGWRSTLLLQGLLIATVVSVIAWIFVRDRPADVGLQTDGCIEGDEQPLSESENVSWTLRALFKCRDFWCITVAVGLTFAVSQAILASLIPYARDINIGVGQASFLVSALALSSIAGKLAFGTIADRVDKRWLLLVIILFIIVQLATLLAQPGFVTLLLILSVAGFATGGELPVWAALVADRFGSLSYGSVMGTMNLLNMLGSLVALRFIGETYDRTGNYQLALQSFLVVVVVAVVATSLITRKGKY